MKATIKLEHDLVAVEGDREINAMLEIAVPEPATDAARAPLALALVIDRSGSMQGDKLAYAKRSAEWLAGRLRSDDRLAIVDYDDEVRLLAPLQAVGPQHTRALRAMHPGGQTNLSGGWLKGWEQVQGAEGVRKVLLLTDGLANVGVTDTPTLVGMAAAAQEKGIGTTTIGFGDGFNEDLLTAMADAGGGNGHYAETADAAPAIFAEEFDDLTRLVAQNVSAEIRPADAVEFVGVLNEYPHGPVPGGIQISIGDAYAGEHRRIVFTLQVPALAELGVEKVADVVLRYVSVGEQVEHHELTIPIVVNRVSADEAAAATPDLQVREEVLVLAAAQARDEAIRLADEGRFGEGQRVLHRTVVELRDAGLSEHADLLDQEIGALGAHDLPTRKRLRYQSQRQRRGKQI
jgi:Ca-activated chloride channel family protein